MTGAFDRRVQELADSVAQGLQPSIQFVTPEFYVVKSAESIDNTTATFTGTSAVTPLASDTYVAVYPYRGVSTDAWQIGRTHIRMTLPEQQSHPFQFKDLGMMIAKTPDSGSEQVRLSFKNIFPILKFSLTGSRTLAAIRFRGNDGEPVAGDFRLDISGDAYMEADFSGIDSRRGLAHLRRTTFGHAPDILPGRSAPNLRQRLHDRFRRRRRQRDDAGRQQKTPRKRCCAARFTNTRPLPSPRSRLPKPPATGCGRTKRGWCRTSASTNCPAPSTWVRQPTVSSSAPPATTNSRPSRVTARLSTVSTAMSISRQAPPRATP